MIENVNHVVDSIAPELGRRPRQMEDKECTVFNIPNLPFCRILALTIWDSIFVFYNKIPLGLGSLFAQLRTRVISVD